jgi:hypothetical protein
VLFELFPWVRDGLQSAPAAATDQHLQAQIARLEALLIAQGSVPLPGTSRALTSVPLPGVTMRKPQAEVSASASKASAETVAQNFLRSMQGLASGLFD